MDPFTLLLRYLYVVTLRLPRKTAAGPQYMML